MCVFSSASHFHTLRSVMCVRACVRCFSISRSFKTFGRPHGSAATRPMGLLSLSVHAEIPAGQSSEKEFKREGDHDSYINNTDSLCARYTFEFVCAFS